MSGSSSLSHMSNFFLLSRAYVSSVCKKFWGFSFLPVFPALSCPQSQESRGHTKWLFQSLSAAAALRLTLAVPALSLHSLPVRFRVSQTWKCQWQFGSVSALWILDWSCQTNRSAKGNGIIIPPLKMADHRYLPVSGTPCVKTCASCTGKYFTYKYWTLL